MPSHATRLQRVLRGALGWLGLAVLAAPLSAAEPAPDSRQTAFFESQVRPVLAGHCYECHSVEQGKSKGGLTLDTRAGVLKGGEDGPVIVPGDPQKSMLIQAIGYGDPDLQMPPKKGKLSDAEIAALTAWVKMGAPDPRTENDPAKKLTGLTAKARAHWAYQPVKKPAVPKVKHAKWCATPIDRFIVAKLEARGMKPAPPAAREALIRRAYYDLIGLPPTPQEVRAFVADRKPTAFATVVDRLLASPRYGERWGRHWLDTARYSDTTGNRMQGGANYRYPYAWTYRDYVIDAFNHDKPFDQFIVEQLAADRLPGAAQNKASLAALGFLTVGERFQNVHDVINERIDTVSKAFLGLTVSCARCHDHKFDPIPTSDYYALHGVFASTIEPVEKPVIARPDPAAFADFEKKRAVLTRKAAEIYEHRLAKLNSGFRQKAAAYLELSATRPGKLSQEEVAARRLALTKAGLDPKVAQEIRQRRRQWDPVLAPYRLFEGLDDRDFQRDAPAIAARIARNNDPHLPFNPLVAEAFKGAKPASLQEVAALYGKVFATADAQTAAFTKASIGPRPAKGPAAAIPGFSPEMAKLLGFPMAVEPAWSVPSSEMRRLRERPLQVVLSEIDELELTHPGAPARAMVVADAPSPRNSPVFIRGQAQVRGPVVPRHFLEILSPDGKPEPFHDGSGRLELARDIASKSNPLTARVVVNRVWMHHFGEGFVRTPEDLGCQSEPPSHPELLDYLASSFMENGWSLKKLHRLIMLSSVYQESAASNAAYRRLDSDNRLLWHANTRRLDFESMRDSLLFYSGKLDPSLGGKPVNLTDEPYSHRRTVYGYIDRGNLPQLMASFDFSNPDSPNSRRNSTVVPQQALFLMNSPMCVDAARGIVARPEFAAAKDDRGRLAALYEILFQRRPRPGEVRLGLKFLAKELAQEPEALNAEALKKAAAEQAKAVALSKQRGNRLLAPIRNPGEVVERTPLKPWEILTHALLFANEASYVY